MKLSKLYKILFYFLCSICHGQILHSLNSNSFVQEMIIYGPYHADDLIDPVEMLEIEDQRIATLLDNKNRSLSKVIRCENNTFNINEAVDDSAYAIVYVSFEIESNLESDAHFYLNTTDGLKLFVNGIQKSAFAANNFYSDEEHVKVKLNKQTNKVVMKLFNKDWDWKLKVKVLNHKEAMNYSNKKREAIEYYQFLNVDVIPLLNLKSDWTHNMMLYLREGRFPKFVLDKPELVRKYLGGGYNLKTRWFDTNLNEVLYPKNTGRYGYYTEIIGKNGDILKKSGTLLCTSNDWNAWSSKLFAKLDYIPVNGIPKDTWDEHSDAISTFLGLQTFESFLMQKKKILFLAFLDDMHKNQFLSDKKLTPLIHDGDYHAKLKQIILGKQNYYKKLKPPSKTFRKNNKLIYNKKKNLHKDSAFTEKMNIICQAWIDDGGSPFDMIIAKEGRIIFHNAFGDDAFGKFTINTPTEIASITKLITGLLFAQFVDQDLIGIDDPVGKYLPDFQIKGSQAVTMRHLFTHTGGFYGHGLFGGVHNQWLDNTLSYVIRGDTVGTEYRYNGTSYDLAGKVMEIITGKSVFRLFQEFLYEPLGMENTYHEWALGYSVHTTAYDLAILAQMLLQEGNYGGKKYFSKETFKKLLPLNLKDVYPDIRYKSSWDENQPKGIGIVMQNWEIDDKENNSKKFLLSDQVIGHGSATSSVFRIDLINKIVITQSRRMGKSNFGDHFLKVYEAIDEQLNGDL